MPQGKEKVFSPLFPHSLGAVEGLSVLAIMASLEQLVIVPTPMEGQPQKCLFLKGRIVVRVSSVPFLGRK